VGSLLLLEDTTGKGHATRIVGGADGLVFAVALADRGSLVRRAVDRHRSTAALALS